MALTAEQKKGFVRRSVEAYIGAYEVCAASGSHCPSTEVLVAGLIEYCYVPGAAAADTTLDAVRDALLEILGDASTGGNASNAKANSSASNAKANPSASNAKANPSASNAKAKANSSASNAKANANVCVAGLKRTRARLIEALDPKDAVQNANANTNANANAKAAASHLLTSSTTHDNTAIANVLAKLKEEESGLTIDGIEKLYKEVIDPVPLAAFVGATIDCSTHGGYCPMLARIVGGIVAHCCRKKPNAHEKASIKQLLRAVMSAQPTVGGGVLKGIARVACGVLAACTAVVSIGLVLIAASAGGSANGIENLFMLPMALGDYAFKGVWFDDDMPDYMTPLELQKE